MTSPFGRKNGRNRVRSDHHANPVNRYRNFWEHPLSISSFGGFATVDAFALVAVFAVTAVSCELCAAALRCYCIVCACARLIHTDGRCTAGGDATAYHRFNSERRVSFA